MVLCFRENGARCRECPVEAAGGETAGRRGGKSEGFGDGGAGACPSEAGDTDYGKQRLPLPETQCGGGRRCQQPAHEGRGGGYCSRWFRVSGFRVQGGTETAGKDYSGGC